MVQINKATGFSKAADSHIAHIQENPTLVQTPTNAHLFLGAARTYDRHGFGAGGRALAGVTDRGTAVNIRTYGIKMEWDGVRWHFENMRDITAMIRDYKFVTTRRLEGKTALFFESIH